LEAAAQALRRGARLAVLAAPHFLSCL
jgi:hypothetical protein